MGVARILPLPSRLSLYSHLRHRETAGATPGGDQSSMGVGGGPGVQTGWEDTVSSRVGVWDNLGLLQRSELLNRVPWAPRKHVTLLLPFQWVFPPCYARVPHPFTQ